MSNEPPPAPDEEPATHHAPPPEEPSGHQSAADPGSTGRADGSPHPEHDDQVAAGAARRVRALLEGFTQLRDRVAALTGEVRTVAARHTELAAAVSEDLGPRLQALQQLLTDEVGGLRRDVDVLLADGRDQDKLKNRPVDWVGLSEEQAKAQWPILARWVGEVLVPWHELTRDDLPDCWAVHRPVVVELSWLRSTYVQAYHPRSPTYLAGEWQVRWRPAALARIKELTKHCQPGEHTPRHGQPLTFTARPKPGEHPGPPATRSQPAHPQCWWPFYLHAYRADLAHRRARAAAEDLDWSPGPAAGG